MNRGIYYGSLFVCGIVFVFGVYVVDKLIVLDAIENALNQCEAETRSGHGTKCILVALPIDRD